MILNVPGAPSPVSGGVVGIYSRIGTFLRLVGALRSFAFTLAKAAKSSVQSENEDV